MSVRPPVQHRAVAASPLQEVTEALHRADAEGFARGYAQARNELAPDVEQLLAHVFADALDSLSSRTVQRSPEFAKSIRALHDQMRAIAVPARVVGLEPADGAQGVAVDNLVSATFDRELEDAELTVHPASGGQALAGEVQIDGKTVTFAPANGLTSGVAYRASVSTKAGDTREWTFTAA